ncbi:hypothetical protein KC19_1G171800 [Ceratodon purpureus]|uniref:Uncharacterized protein n=1 Tax=Ceratodon purpureus TaxID=3225 RepID=A0A8T0J968_CERPU|nr:hypothetical protein KC19_1G171800 [Ceratodon purpureus]
MVPALSGEAGNAGPAQPTKANETRVALQCRNLTHSPRSSPRGRRRIGDKGPQLTQLRNSSTPQNSTLGHSVVFFHPRPGSLPFSQQPFQQPRTIPPPNAIPATACAAGYHAALAVEATF